MKRFFTENENVCRLFVTVEGFEFQHEQDECARHVTPASYMTNNGQPQNCVCVSLVGCSLQSTIIPI